MAERIMVATVNITVPLAVGALTLARGDKVDLDKLPTGTLESMARLGQLVERDEWEKIVAAETAAPAEPAAGDEPEGDQGGEATEWKQTAVADLDLSDDAKRALLDAELDTVQKVLEYAKAHNGLTGLAGIGNANQAHVQKAITAIMPAA